MRLSICQLQTLKAEKQLPALRETRAVPSFLTSPHCSLALQMVLVMIDVTIYPCAYYLLLIAVLFAFIIHWVMPVSLISLPQERWGNTV